MSKDTNTMANPLAEQLAIFERFNLDDLVLDPSWFYRGVSGTYKNDTPASDSTLLELRVDVDGRRPQSRLSGDLFKRKSIFSIYDFVVTPGQKITALVDPTLFLPFYYTAYEHSFVVEEVTSSTESGVRILSGPIIYYQDPTRTNETIEVRIRRVSLFSKAADAQVTIFKSGLAVQTYCLPKISDYFRIVTLEIDRFQGTQFPPGVSSDLDPSPADLAAKTVTTASVFQDAGVDLTVVEDDVLNDSDSDDSEENWSEAELHDLMEDRFDLYANSLQWNTYGVVVPRFGDPTYASTYYGTMFDWGGWQAGDTYFRQGCAIAEDAIEGRSVDTLYDTNAKQDRLILQTFIHEVGHAFNLPHSWSRGSSADSASQSFMNYPWGYTGGGGESGFWSDFYWQFDDVELVWMRHQDRNDVIFGGTDWIGNNLSVFLEPQTEIRGAPLALTVEAEPVLDFAEPVRLELALTNISSVPQLVVDRLDPEDRFLSFYIRRPSGEIARYVPPVRRLKAPGNLVKLDPGERLSESALVSFGARGHQFQEPGEYRVRAYYGRDEDSAIASRAARFRVSAPHARSDEELAYLLFGRDAAKFLYFGGTERYPEVTSQLEEAAKRHEKSNPRVVRHLRAALGVHHSRAFKRAELKGKKRVVVTRKPRLRAAISHLKGSLAVPSGADSSVIHNARYAELSRRLADCQKADRKAAQAKETLAAGKRYLQSRNAEKRLLEKLGEESQTRKKGKTGRKKKRR